MRLCSRGFFLLEGVIRGTNQRTCFHVLESHLLAESLEFREFIRMDVSLDRQMFVRRLHVLPERQDVRALRGDFFHRLQYFIARLAEPSIMPVFVGTSGAISRARRSNSSDRS